MGLYDNLVDIDRLSRFKSHIIVRGTAPAYGNKSFTLSSPFYGVLYTIGPDESCCGEMLVVSDGSSLKSDVKTPSGLTVSMFGQILTVHNTTAYDVECCWLVYRGSVTGIDNLFSCVGATPSANNTVSVTDYNSMRIATTTNAKERQATVDIQLKANTTYRLTCSAVITSGTASIRYKLGSSSADVASKTMTILVGDFTASRDISVAFTTGSAAYARIYFYNTSTTVEAGDVAFNDIFILEET